jgi:hypothetical protein
MDCDIEKPSITFCESRRPPAADNDLINVVILGSSDILTVREAEPSAEIVPLMRDAQEKKETENTINGRKTYFF